jgi:hypothetical protein
MRFAFDQDMSPAAYSIGRAIDEQYSYRYLRKVDWAELLSQYDALEQDYLAICLMTKQVPGCKLVGGKSYGSSGNPKPTDLGNEVTVFLPSWKADSRQPYDCGFITLPMKRMLLVLLSRIKNRNGWSARKTAILVGPTDVSRSVTPVAAAASVPSSFTST